MKRSRKSNRISWAQGVNLCQVKLFLSEDSPSKVGLKSQDHLQEKVLWAFRTDMTEFSHCPPGFEPSHLVYPLKKEVSQIPLIEWRCPPKFVTSSNWRVAAGEESKEVEYQKMRETSVLEAVFPRLSAIPPSPSVSLGAEDEPYDDSLTPAVPIDPIEEEDEFVDVPSDLAPSQIVPFSSGPMASPNCSLASATPNTPISDLPAVEPSAGENPALAQKLSGASADVIAAASTALAVIMETNERGSLVDTDLLIKILSDPKMIQTLSNEQRAQAKSGMAPADLVSDPKPESKLVLCTQSAALSIPKLDTERPPNGKPPHVPLSGVQPSVITTPSRMDNAVPIPVSGLKRPAAFVPLSGHEPNSNPITVSMPASTDNFYTAPKVMRPTISAISSQPNIVSTFSSVEQAQPVKKDINYYKNLIRQHGEQQEISQKHVIGQNSNRHYQFQDLKTVQNVKSGNLKPPKNQKPCMYFKTPKGCRNGVNCPYKHDVSIQWRNGNILEAQSAKRMKLMSGEIIGWI